MYCLFLNKMRKLTIRHQDRNKQHLMTDKHNGIMLLDFALRTGFDPPLAYTFPIV